MFDAAVETEAIKRRLIFMWLATKYGFFSIVKKDDGFHVRARSRRDLEILREALIKWLRPTEGLILEIKDTPNSDYCSRIVLQDVRLLFDCVSESIDYPGLRKEIEATPEQADKLGFYSSIWSTMGAYQAITLHRDDEDEADEDDSYISYPESVTDRRPWEKKPEIKTEIDAGFALRGVSGMRITNQVAESGPFADAAFLIDGTWQKAIAPPSPDHGCDRFGHEGELDGVQIVPCGYCGAAA